MGWGVGLCPAQWQAALNRGNILLKRITCDPVRSCELNSIRWRIHHKSCVHASSDPSGYGPIHLQVLTRFVYSTLNDGTFMRSRTQVQRRQAEIWQRERARVVLFSGKSSSRLPVRRRASSWRSRRRGPERGELEMGGGVLKRNTRRQTPTMFERSPTRRAAKAAMWRRRARAICGVLVSRCRRPGVQAAEFSPRSPRRCPRRSTDLESRPKRLSSRMDAEHTREVRVGARGESV